MAQGAKRSRKQQGSTPPAGGDQEVKKRRDAASRSEPDKRSAVAARGGGEGNRLPAIARIKEFAAEVKAEFGKIVWPERKQTLGTAVVVVVLVMLISLYLGTVDLVLGKLVQFILD